MQTLLHFFDINTVFFMVGDYAMSYLEFFGTIFNIIAVYLVAKNKIINRPIGILGVILYIALFYQIQLYSDLAEQIYFLITGFYGWYVWSTLGNQKASDDNISYTNSQEKLGYVISIIIGTVVMWYVTTHLNVRFPVQFPEAASFAWLDAFTTVLSFAATILMIRQKVECWYLWILVDVIGIYLYYVKGVKFIALEYVLFLIMATGGLIKWIKIYQKR